MSQTMPNMAQIKDFLLNSMKLPEDLVSDLQILGIRKIHPRKLPIHRQKSDDSRKVTFMLRDAHECDVVISYASNLSGDDRLDIVIPDHLLSLKTRFDALSYKLRKHVDLTSGNTSKHH